MFPRLYWVTVASLCVPVPHAGKREVFTKFKMDRGRDACDRDCGPGITLVPYSYESFTTNTGLRATAKVNSAAAARMCHAPDGVFV
ncbi:hypothetical protein BGY98DRAFT_992677 [Russula aff. rugulosa BPL654]|nr:hypothetical protein BGY98DRAFT_992677 [Russula aff. rugulosa BPL654]